MKKLILTSLCVLFVAGTALAQPDDGDPCKVHYAMLSNPYSWSVPVIQPKSLADDHWSGETDTCQTDILGTIIDPHLNTYYSNLAKLLSSWDIRPYLVRQETTSLHGWFNTSTAESINKNDQSLWLIYNSLDAHEPFCQENDIIYWLDISLTTNSPRWAWQTSIPQHFEIDDIWANWLLPHTDIFSQEPRAPIFAASLDLTFVSTPLAGDGYSAGSLASLVLLRTPAK